MHFRKCFEGIDEPEKLNQVCRRNAPTFSIVLAALSAWAGAEAIRMPVHTKQAERRYQGNMEHVDKEIIRVLSAMAVIIALT